MLTLHLPRATRDLAPFAALSLVARVHAFRDQQGGGPESLSAAPLDLMFAYGTAVALRRQHQQGNRQTLVQHLLGARRSVVASAIYRF